MGRVYLGRSAAGRLVAVKTIKLEFAEEDDFRARFAQEVAAARRVNGVFTAGVVAADPDADVPWLATAYVPAPSLDRLVRTCGPLPVPAVRWLAAGCAEALASIHDAGLVHRDLKPSNVLVAPDGPRVIDFGVARAAEPAHLTSTHGSVGTPAYMAPEQARDTRTGPASDVFSLGSTLLFAASGHAPYLGQTGRTSCPARHGAAGPPAACHLNWPTRWSAASTVIPTGGRRRRNWSRDRRDHAVRGQRRAAVVAAAGGGADRGPPPPAAAGRARGGREHRASVAAGAAEETLGSRAGEPHPSFRAGHAAAARRAGERRHRRQGGPAPGGRARPWRKSTTRRARPTTGWRSSSPASPRSSWSAGGWRSVPGSGTTITTAPPSSRWISGPPPVRARVVRGHRDPPAARGRQPRSP